MAGSDDAENAGMRHAVPSASGRAQSTGPSRWAQFPKDAATLRPCDSIDLATLRTAHPRCPTLVDRIRSTPTDVRQAVTALGDSLTAQQMDPADWMILEIVLAEALNNIVEHAYREDEGGWILLEVDYLAGWVACRLTDGGVSMPGERLPNPRRPDAQIESATDIASLPEGGFGWSMIFELTSFITYRREGALNFLCFALALSGPGRADPLLPRRGHEPGAQG